MSRKFDRNDFNIQLTPPSFLQIVLIAKGGSEKMSSESKDQQQLIFLWIVPRTCSTVFSKCMTFVDDVQVWMEPYLGCLVNETLYNPSFEPENVGFNLFREKLREVEATDAMKSLRKEIKK